WTPNRSLSHDPHDESIAQDGQGRRPGDLQPRGRAEGRPGGPPAPRLPDQLADIPQPDPGAGGLVARRRPLRPGNERRRHRRPDARIPRQTRVDNLGSPEGTPMRGMQIRSSDTALVVIDPQNDVLSEKGISWGLVGESVRENHTVENIERLFRSAKERGF